MGLSRLRRKGAGELVLEPRIGCFLDNLSTGILLANVATKVKNAFASAFASFAPALA